MTGDKYYHRDGRYRQVSLYYLTKLRLKAIHIRKMHLNNMEARH